MKNDNKLYVGNALEVLKTMEDNSVDSIVTDPPYGLSFMNKKWDYDVPDINVWQECLRVLKPGGHLLSFGGSRTYHRMVVNIEDAGFEIRDQIMWVYGSGFPKSLNIGKAVDKMQGNEREIIGINKHPTSNDRSGNKSPYQADNSHLISEFEVTKGSSEWEGWGTALKPAHEPIVLARKPLIGTVAQNVLEYGTGGINIDGCRVETSKDDPNKRVNETVMGGFQSDYVNGEKKGKMTKHHGVEQGRFPANFIHDGSDEVLSLFPVTNGEIHDKKSTSNPLVFQKFKSMDEGSKRSHSLKDSGSAARFFYTSKASKHDRDEGCEGLDRKPNDWYRESSGLNKGPNERKGGTTNRVLPSNHHPTVKPTDLMRYLCRLITPPNGIILDPFMGSGSTGKAALLEGFKFIGIDEVEEYVIIAKARIEYVIKEKEKKNVYKCFF